MRIVIYTSANPGCNNLRNITFLLESLSQHEFYFLVVKSVPKKMRIREKVKECYVRLRYYGDARFEFKNDIQRIDKRVRRQFRKMDIDQFPVFYVDKVNDAASEKKLIEIQPDMILQAGAGILKQNIFNIPLLGTINVHHGISPEIRGIYSTFWCLYYGMHDKIGVTCHFIDRDLDTGTVIDQMYYKYHAGDSFVDIQVALAELGTQVLINAILKIKNEFEVAIEPVESYYFGSPSSLDYAKLKGGGFVPIGHKTELRTKLLQKREIIVNKLG